ncbi:MAG: DUF4372 domain-containing protein [Sedimenticola sp.]
MRYNGNRHTKSFSCSGQFRCMAFSKLTFSDRLRDTGACLTSKGLPDLLLRVCIQAMRTGNYTNRLILLDNPN